MLLVVTQPECWSLSIYAIYLSISYSFHRRGKAKQHMLMSVSMPDSAVLTPVEHGRCYVLAHLPYWCSIRSQWSAALRYVYV